MYKKPKGTKDIFGLRQTLKKQVDQALDTIASFYNFKKIDTPTFEVEEIFKRSVGETSDIVSKEMYDFTDKKGRKLVLRPEGTAGVIRAFVENKMYTNSQPTKLYYNGSIFRYERPQKGRQREFTQFGVELIGEKTPFADVEVIMMSTQILRTLQFKEFTLSINSIGDKETRDRYSQELKRYFENYKDQLTSLSIERLEKNPLRILDDKIDGKKDFVINAPKISEFYSKESEEYFDKVKELLDAIGMEYKVSDKLVRGLDYYSETIFEFVSKSKIVGKQSTILGGGRYDNMVSNFGGPKLSGVGFAIGLERLLNELEEIHEEEKEVIDVYVANIDAETALTTNSIAYMLRNAGFVTEYNYKPLNLKKVFDKAKIHSAKFIVIFGKKEALEQKVVIKNQINGQQDKVDIMNIVKYLDKRIEE